MQNNATHHKRQPRRFTSEDEARVRLLLKRGQRMDAICAAFQDRKYQSLYSLITRLEANGRIAPDVRHHA